MRCQFCHNPDSWKTGVGEEWSADDLLDKAERFEMDKSSGRYNVFVVNDLRGQAAAVENARRQALAAANDLIRVYSMLDIKLNRGLLDNIMLLGLHHAVDPLEAGAERENWEIP